LTEPQVRLAIDEGLSLRVLGLLSFNAEGRIRELATRVLAGLSGGEEVPFLLLRANDWVSQVVQPARNGLLRRCTAEYASIFAAALPLVERVAGKRRVDHGGLVRAIHALAWLRSLASSPEQASETRGVPPRVSSELLASCRHCAFPTVWRIQIRVSGLCW
jgi:hypothetical protein